MSVIAFKIGPSSKQAGTPALSRHYNAPPCGSQKSFERGAACFGGRSGSGAGSGAAAAAPRYRRRGGGVQGGAPPRARTTVREALMAARSDGARGPLPTMATLPVLPPLVSAAQSAACRRGVHRSAYAAGRGHPARAILSL